jgi:uncharacterized membrane protein YjgN (DUF898 family)
MSQYPQQFPAGRPAQEHPQATTILVLGILGLVLCQVLGPFAWSMGNKALREIDSSQGTLGGRETVNIGRILGIVSTALLGFAVLAVAVVVIVAILSATLSTSP